MNDENLLGAAKAIITIDGTNNAIMSIKKSSNTQKDKKLEFIGGRLDINRPYKELLRELQEEDLSQLLFSVAKKTELPYKTITLPNNEPQYIFEFSITLEQFNTLIPNSDESYGFKLVNKDSWSYFHTSYLLTKKTTLILQKLKYLH